MHVVLLHGLGRSARAMRPLEHVLQRDGYTVLKLGYPSRSAGVRALAERVAKEMLAWAPPGPFDCVTHSLGGVLVRVAVAEGRLPRERLRRVVMIGPPNGGSELADRLPRIPVVASIYRAFTGPAGAELGTGPTSLPRGLPPVDFTVGVIAGTRSYNPLLGALVPKPNDGKVTVASTRVEGMTDFIELPAWHPAMAASPAVQREVLAFLRQGTFGGETKGRG